MITEKEKCVVDEIIEKYGGQKKAVIAVMQDIQAIYRYLPRDILEYVSERLGVSDAKVYSVATFYENFSLEPKGKHLVKICDGTACHVRHSIRILNAIRRHLKLSEKKHTTDDGMFTVETVSCLGACSLAPVLTIDEKVYAAMTPESAVALLKEIEEDGVV